MSQSKNLEFHEKKAVGNSIKNTVPDRSICLKFLILHIDGCYKKPKRKCPELVIINVHNFPAYKESTNKIFFGKTNVKIISCYNKILFINFLLVLLFCAWLRGYGNQEV